MKISPRLPHVGQGAKLRTVDRMERQRANCVCQDLVPGPARDGPDSPGLGHEIAHGKARTAAAESQSRDSERKLRAASRRPPATRPGGQIRRLFFQLARSAPPRVPPARTRCKRRLSGAAQRLPRPGQAKTAPSCPATTSGRCRRRAARARAASCPGWPPCPRGAPRTPRWRRPPEPR